MKMLYLSRQEDGRVFAEGKCVIERYGKDFIQQFILCGDYIVDDMFQVITDPKNYDLWYCEVRIGDEIGFMKMDCDAFIAAAEKLPD